MAAPIKPALTRAYGNESWVFVPTIANVTAPTIAEINAASGMNISCVLFGDQESVSATTEKVQLPRRMCETEVAESNGATSWTFPDLLYQFDPQAAPGSDGKKAKETLIAGSDGYLVQRLGVTSTDDFAATQRVNVFPVELAAQVVVKTSNDANGVVAIRQAVSMRNTPTIDVAIVA